MGAPAVILAAGDILQARVCCYNTDQISLNVLGYKVVSLVGVPGVTLQDVVGQIDSDINGTYKSLMALTARYRGVGLRRLLAVPSLEYTAIGNDGIGTGGASLQGRQVTGMFTKVSGVIGPAGRGRVYVPFPDTDSSGPNGQPNAGYMVNLGILAGILQSTFGVTVGGSTVNMAPCILRRSALGSSLIWGAATARQRWATQKRRGDYGKTNVLPF